MTVKLLTKHHLEFLSLKGGCTGSSESTLDKITYYLNSAHRANTWFYANLICVLYDLLQWPWTLGGSVWTFALHAFSFSNHIPPLPLYVGCFVYYTPPLFSFNPLVGFKHVCTSRVENIVVPDYMASQKPADQYLHCFSNRRYPCSTG